MPKENPTLYNVQKTFIWFAIVSIILTLSLVGIVWLDYAREWKLYQKQFIQLKTQMAKEELKEVESKIDKKKLGDLEKQLKDTEATLKTHQGDQSSLRSKIGGLDTEVTKAKTKYQDLKQSEDSARYYFEELRAQGDSKAFEYEKKLKELSPPLSPPTFHL